MRLEGKVIDPNTTYRIAVNNFLAGGGDRFVILKEGRHVVQGGGDLEAFRDYVAGATKPFPAVSAGRICRK